jgi:TolB protein
MNDDGSNLRALAQVEEYSNISFSPDSSRLVYSFGKGHDSEIYMLYIEDGTIEQITHNAFGDYEPIWSPDGEKILFSSARDNELYVMALDGSNLQQLTDNELVDIGVSWSPDGQYIVFSSYLADRRIQFVMNSDGSAPRNITEQPYDGILDVVWSPDGQSLGFIIRDGYKQELYLIDVDGSNLRQIAGDLKMASDLAWSPDGRYLIFGVGLPYTQLYISTIDNTDIYSLTRDDKRTIFELSWQPAPR